MYPRNIQYRGCAEYLAYGEIAQNAIEVTISRDHIETLAQSPIVGRFLRIDLLKNSVSVKSAQVNLSSTRHALSLDQKVGAAVAQLLLFFGFSFLTEESSLIEGTFSLLQGWMISIPLQYQDAISHSFEAFYKTFLHTIPGAQSITEVRNKFRRCFVFAVERTVQFQQNKSRGRFKSLTV
jgi:hypothetical protein